MSLYYEGEDYCDEYEPQMFVVTACDHAWVSSESVEFLDIQEDIQGRDVMTFRCPKCGAEHNSYVVGR